ncbi:MAG: 7-cyano-7-deazaguanine synthase QueC [Candidatus Cloacimonetes bacterium]|nr:7-cyano-7-deazaguanine synthase QueC [Candidatus Cloacimonadota bacterium]
MKNSAIVLLSGGMDSLVTAGIAANEMDELNFLHVNYGQKTEVRELRSFRRLVEYFHPQRQLVTDISYLKEIGGSSLTDPAMEVEDYQERSGIPATYVPFRNGHLVAIAVSWAEVIEAQNIYLGAVEEDSSGYPDCRESFYQAMENAIALGSKTGSNLKIITPIIHKSKEEIIRLGLQLDLPFQFSWSCYKNNDIACGVCDSCVLRIRAFRKAGVKDPLPYAIDIDWNS